MAESTVLAIGRWMPIHIGHKKFLTELAGKYDRLVVGIGSCYENGTPRNCIPAIEREKLLRRIFRHEGLSNVIIIPVQDRPTFEEWFGDVVSLCGKYDVTHFCTGNKEDILNVMKEKGLTLSAELIDPEATSDFPYHATDIRNAILRGETDRLDTMIPAEIKETVLAQVAKEIKTASEGKGQEFVPGRQTVDTVFVVNDTKKGKKYLLIGKRNDEKIDFPGYYAIPGGGIREFESPIEAAVRCFKAETGIDVSVRDNSTEPAEGVINNLGEMNCKLHFTGIYASHDERINGTRGGGSQCFAVLIDGDTEYISELLHSEHDMTELLFIDVDEAHAVDFAYDQKRMVYDALDRLNISYDRGELLRTYDEEGNAAGEGISRRDAHRYGVLHGASHTYIYKREAGKLMLLLQRRSYNKDSYPGRLDTSSAGHVEMGSDFLETACKELREELGLEVSPDRLTELFEQRIDQSSEFHGQPFIDREINRIYALELDCDPSELELQPSEVCRALWMSADGILSSLDTEDSELCMNGDEIRKVIEILN